MCTLLLYLPEGYQKFVIIKPEQNKKITFNLQILWDSMCWRVIYHSDLNDQNLFHSTIDEPPGVSKNPDLQTEVHSGELER